TGGPNDASTFNAVVMTNNRTSGGGSPVGAGIGNGAGSLTVTNSTIGGTVAAAACPYQAVTNDTNRTFILSNSVIQNNNTTGGNGAGLITSANAGTYATKSITNTS